MRYIFFLLTLVVIVGQSVSAQERYSLALEEAQTYALEHNRQLKNASIDIKKAEATRWQSIATMLPQINASVDYSNMMGYKMALSGFDISMPPSATAGLTVSVALSASQIIGVQLQNISSKMADIALEQTELQVANQVKSIYYSSLVMEETVNLLEKNLENLHKLLEHTRQMVKVGMSDETAADQIAVQVASMESSLNSGRRSLEMLYNSLRLQLGLDVDREIELTQSINDLMNIDKALSLLLVEFVPENNHDYRLLLQNLEISKKQVDMKKWAHAPSLSAFYQFTEKKYFSDEETMNMTAPNTIGFTLSIPVFSSGSRHKALQEAKFDYQKQLNTFEDTKESLIIQHRQLRYNLQSAYEDFEAQKKNMEVIQRLFDNISRKYEKGAASSLEVTESGSNLIAAQSNYVQSLMNMVTAQIELEELLNQNYR